MEPSAVLSTWAAGLAAGASLVIGWRIVGRGYVWLALGTAGLFAAVAAIAGGGIFAIVGLACALAGAVGARRPERALIASIGATIALLIAGFGEANPWLVTTGALALGGVTSEMMLGHWYLVDPRLPRTALRRLDLLGMAGVALDAVATAVAGAIPWAAGDAVAGIGWLVLVATTLLLLTGVWFSLGEKGYSGVMAATGLSYLAVLTSIGVVVLGRLLVDGPILG